LLLQDLGLSTRFIDQAAEGQADCFAHGGSAVESNSEPVIGAAG
jgi:hypothetical protein